MPGSESENFDHVQRPRAGSTESGRWHFILSQQSPPTLPHANLRYPASLNLSAGAARGANARGQNEDAAASFFCPRSFDRAVIVVLSDTIYDS